MVPSEAYTALSELSEATMEARSNLPSGSCLATTWKSQSQSAAAATVAKASVQRANLRTGRPFFPFRFPREPEARPFRPPFLDSRSERSMVRRRSFKAKNPAGIGRIPTK